MLKLLKLFRFIKKYAWLILASLFLVIISSFLSLIQPKLLEWAVDAGITKQNIANTFLAAGAHAELMTRKDFYFHLYNMQSSQVDITEDIAI